MNPNFSNPEISLTESAFARICEIKQQQQNRNKFLRLSVLGGGCSGFQYVFELDEKNREDDVKIAEKTFQSDNNLKEVLSENLVAVTDQTSMQFLSGAQIDFVKELGASYFKVVNPNAKANCGCGASFAV